MVKKRAEVGKLIHASGDIGAGGTIRPEDDANRLLGGSTALARIDFGAGGMENTP